MQADLSKLPAMRDEGICPVCGEKLDVWIMNGPVAVWSTYTCAKCTYQLREHVRTPENLGDVPKR